MTLYELLLLTESSSSHISQMERQGVAAKAKTLLKNLVKEGDGELGPNTSCWEAELGVVYKDSLEALLPIS